MVEPVQSPMMSEAAVADVVYLFPESGHKADIRPAAPFLSSGDGIEL